MEYLKTVIVALGISCLTFVVIPWLGVVIIRFFKAIWNDNNRLD